MVPYTSKELKDANEFITSLGIKAGDKLYDSAIEWYIENKRNNNPIFTKPQEKDYVDYIILNLKGGLEAYKRKHIYKSIIKEITAIYNISDITGTSDAPNQRPERPPQAPRRPRRAASSRSTTNSPGTSSTGHFIEDRLTGTLRFAVPKYNNIIPKFDNDFDRVAYILRNRRTKSSKHEEYFAWARAVSGQNDETIRKHGNKVLREIKKIVSSSETINSNQIRVPPIPLDFIPSPRKQSQINPERLLNSPSTAESRQTGQSESTTPILPNGVIGQDVFSGILESLKSIQESINSILKIVEYNHKSLAQTASRNRILDQNQRREYIEAKSEKRIEGFINESLKLFTPIKGILERILNFIVYTLLGRTMVSLINWMSNPDNRNKVKSISRFLKDWWPILLGSYVLFFTKFGKVIRGAIGLSLRLTKSMLTIIPSLLKFLKLFGRKGAVAALAVGGLATVGGLYLKNKSDEEEQRKNKESIPILPQTRAYKSGGIIKNNKQRKLNVGDIRSTGNITNKSGVSITGAGPDTQLIAAQPGEYVISKAGVMAANKLYGKGFLEGLNKMAGASGIPRIVNNIQLASQGGPVGGSKIRPEDYYSLLAISAAEDNTPQGRADVAQSIYNRLFATSSPYNMSFNQTDGRSTIKDLITGDGQYQPTFNNRQDWLSIRDRKSAIRALAGHLANKSGGSMSSMLKEAAKMIKDTELALKDPNLQKEASRFVQGRLSFYGTSERASMSGDDVIRMKNVDGKMVDALGNSFSNHLADDLKNPYATQRRNVAAPVPLGIAPSRTPSVINKPKSKQSNFLESIFGIFNQFLPKNIQSKPNIKVPPPRTKKQDISVLPQINSPAVSNSPKYFSPVGSDVPTFNLYPPSIISDRNLVKTKLGMAA